ncbi:MAG: ABC transporter ATP-binding protein [Candidatus Schekmanbacteria bacterium]|nr:MAG: ABC transporter ATP-binding protein [Candidatus Schekmanbacteria bacterium]
MNYLLIENISKSFSDSSILKKISFEVEKGEFCVILGPSGCGKTTLLKIIAGIERQDSGKIFLENDISNIPPQRRNIAMVFQSYALYPHMSIFENMAFPLKMQKMGKKEIEERVISTAKLLKIENHLKKKPRQLSGGERQRVALGRAIVRNPKLFLFDEPLSNLDARLRSKMRREIIDLHNKLQTTIIYVTHDQFEAMTMADKIILLNKGEIQQIGTPDELYNSPKNLFTAQFIGTPEINLIEGYLVNEEGRFFFKSGNFSLEIGTSTKLKEIEGEKIIMGIRSESFYIDKGNIRGKIRNLENLGSEILAYIDIEGLEKKLVIKCPKQFQGKTGSDIALDIKMKEIHFFKDEENVWSGCNS